MGIRVSFFVGAVDGLETILLDSMSDFKKWYEKLIEEWPDECDLEILESANEILAGGRDVLNVYDQASATKVDKLVDEFVGSFCDYGDGPHILKNAHESCLYLRRYAAYRDHFEIGSPLRRFWDFLLDGRPVFRDPETFPYKPTDGLFSVSFVTADEARVLLLAFLKVMPIEVEVLKIARDALETAYNERLGLIMTIA